MRQAEHDRRVWDDEGEERRRGRAGRIPVSCQGCECKRRAARSVSNPPFENICTRHGCLFWPPDLSESASVANKLATELAWESRGSGTDPLTLPCPRLTRLRSGGAWM